MQSVKIGFIQATNDVDVHWFKPLAFGYLKAYLLKHFDSPFEMDFIDINNITNKEYDIIGISSTSQDYGKAVQIASEIKKRNPDIITIIGGHHITYLPNTITDDIDIGVMGEGEETFLELVNLLIKSERKIKKDEIRQVKGIVFHGDNGLEITERRELIRPLDRIPHPVRFQDSEQYIFTSRGCPYRCAFCSSSSFWNKTRMFTAEYVVNEIELLLDQFPDIRHITVEDDLFVLNIERFKKIAKLLDRKGLMDRLKFSFSIRANLVDDKFCDTIKMFNIESVYFGAESSSNRILKILKKGITADQNQNALNTLYKHNIPCLCSFIIGVPGETEEEIKGTYEFLMNNLLDGKLTPGSPVNILMPMPGTKIWDDAVESGYIDLNNFDWNRLAIFASYRHSNVDSFEDWVTIRKKNRSLYLNQNSVDEDRLYEIMYYYEEKLKKIDQIVLKEEELRRDNAMLNKQIEILNKKTSSFKDAANIIKDITIMLLDGEPEDKIINKTGELCYHLGLTNSAYLLLKKAHEKNPLSDEIFNNLGVVCFIMGNFKTAKMYFEKALRINPDNKEAQKNILHLLALIENNKELPKRRLFLLNE